MDLDMSIMPTEAIMENVDLSDIISSAMPPSKSPNPKTITISKSSSAFHNSEASKKSSLSAKATSNKASAVTSLRKQELLLEARRARVEWVDASSHPLRKLKPTHTSHHPLDLDDLPEETSQEEDDEDENTMHKRKDANLNLISKSHAGQSIKTAIDVVKVLYGIGEEEGGGYTYEQAHHQIAKQVRSIRIIS